MTRLRIGLGQLAPGLGLLEANLAEHRRTIEEAARQGVNLLAFPELGLTGYLLQDLNSEVAMRADDQRLIDLAAVAPGMSVIVGFVEESASAQLYISAALLEQGEVRHVYRKSYLPNYGLFDERRFFGAGDQIGAVDSQLGVRLGLCICEDFWHLPSAYLLALDGAQVLVNISSSPGRDIAAPVEGGLGSAESWDTLMRAYAQLTTSYVVFVNRVGVEESVTFWGGSRVIDPSGDAAFVAPLLEAGLYTTEIDLDAVRRERMALPLLRDERPEFVLRQLERIVRERSGQADEADSGQ
ncbi:MAG TPA: nitrilase-related carbon-nitrogen hydrolase [Candidatus Limnocylindrales bacterium]|nr:nitrilase-related carbon-nitrogen hydrolase [Candidatus Limnocylindrales bacterium]